MTVAMLLCDMLLLRYEARRTDRGDQEKVGTLGAARHGQARLTALLLAVLLLLAIDWQHSSFVLFCHGSICHHMSLYHLASKPSSS